MTDKKINEEQWQAGEEPPDGAHTKIQKLGGDYRSSKVKS